METVVLIMIAFIGVALGYVLANGDTRERMSVFVNTERHRQKESRKLMLLSKLTREGRITNDDVQKLFDVSHSTATRYFDELQAEGRIDEKGDGSGTFYVLRGEEAPEQAEPRRKKRKKKKKKSTQSPPAGG